MAFGLAEKEVYNKKSLIGAEALFQAHFGAYINRYHGGADHGGLGCLRRYSRGLERGSPCLEVIEHLTQAGW